MKIGKPSLKYKRPNGLWLLLCVLGVALVAWWAWAAGPVQTKSALSAGSKTSHKTTIAEPVYTPVNTAPAAQSTSGTNAGSTVPVQTAPSSSPPVNKCIQPEAGIQPDFATECGCRGYSQAYPCCQYGRGTMIACPISY